MANLVGTATIKIIPDTAGFSAALNSQLKSVSAAANKSVSGTLGALGQAQQSLGALGDSLSRTGQRAILAGGAMTYGLTRPLVGLASTMISTAAEFERSLNTIAAVADIDLGSAELDRIGTMARDLAKTFPQDANAIAKGMLDLARAGLETADQIESVITPIMQLSTIEDIDLAKASDLLVNVFTGFGGSFSDVGAEFKTIFGEARATTEDLTAEFTRMGDILATVSAATTTDLVDLGNAFRYAGPVAAAAGLNFQETASALGVLAQAGFNATVGGTALRGIITRLAIPTKLSQEIFDKFGLSVEEAFAPDTIQASADGAEELSKSMRAAGYSAAEISTALGTKGVTGLEEFNAQLTAMGLSTMDVFDQFGQMRPLQDIVDTFVASGARVGDVMKLFGQRSGPAFLALMKQAEAFRDLTAETQNADGALGEMSDKIEQSAEVKFILLKNAIVDLAISVGESGLLDFFSELAINLTEFIQNLSDTNPQIVKWVFVFGGLVAILGPATLLFGLLADSVSKLVHVLAFLISGPVAGVIAGIAAVAIAFGLMYTQSESLRAAVAVLGESLSAVFGPILEVGRVMLGALGGGVSALAEQLGNLLAPKIIEVAEVINNWISNGGLAEFLTGVGEKVVEIGGFFYDLVQTIQDLGIMAAIGDAIQRVWGDAVEFFSHFESVVRNLIPTIMELGTVIGTGAAIYIRMLWQGGAALLSVFEKILDVAGPIISFLGDNLTTVLTILIAKMLLTRNTMIQTATGLGLLAGAAERTGTRISAAFNGAATRVFNFGQGVQRMGSFFNAQMVGWSGQTSRFGGALERMGAMGARGSLQVAAGLQLVGAAAAKVGAVMTGVFANGQLIMAGFFSGMMIGRAETMGEALTGLIPIIIALGVALLSIGGPVGIIVALGTALGALAGMALGAGDSVTKVIGIDIPQSIDQLVSAMSDLDGMLTKENVLSEFTEQINELNPRNFSTLQGTLKATGHTVEELATALDGGSESAADFANTLANDFVNKNLSGELDSLTFKVDKLNEMTGYYEKTEVGGDIAKQFAEAGQYVEVFNKGSEESFARIDNLNDLTGAMASNFQTTFGGDLISGFGVSLDEARLKFEAMQPLLELQQRNQDYVNDKAKTWVDRISDANRSLDETKQRMRDLFAPTDDVTENIVELFETIRQSKDAFINPATGLPWTEVPAPDTEAGAKYFRAVQDIKGLWSDTQAIIVQGINPALDDAVKIDIFKNELLAKRIQFVNNLASIYQISPEQATALADQIAGVLPTDQEIAVKLGIDETGLGTIEAQYKALQERFQLDTNQVKIFAEFELNPTSAEADEFAKIIGGIKDISPQKLDIIVATLDQMDPALRGWVQGLISSGKVAPENIQSFIELIPMVSEAGIGGVSGATLAALLQGQSPQAIQQLIDVIPNVASIGGLSPDDTAKVVQMLIGKTPEDIRQFIEILPDINMDNIPGLTPEQDTALTAIIAGAPPGDAQKIIDMWPTVMQIPGLTPEQQAEMTRVLAGKSPEDAEKLLNLAMSLPEGWGAVAPLLEQLSPAQAELILNVSANATEAAAAALAAIAKNSLSLDVLSPFANGGIFNEATPGIMGEDGMEVLIPLTKPNRARQLIEASGLYSKFPPMAPASTQTLGGSPAVLPAGTFQAVTPAAESYAAAIYATGVASAYSATTQEELAAILGVPMDNIAIITATERQQEFNAALREAINLMEIMANGDASGIIQEDDPRWDWMTMGNRLGPGGLTADQYNALDPAIQALLDQADNYAEAVDILDDYGFTGFSPGVSPTLAGNGMSGMDVLSGMPAGGVTTPDRAVAGGNSLSIAVTVEATPDTTKEHAAMVGESVADGINRKLAIKSAVFSS
jgi:hypothetical protein